MRRTDLGCPLRSHEPRCEITFQNYPGTDLQLELFQALAGYLIDLGLCTEQIAAAPKKGGGDAAAPSPDYVFCFTPRMHRVAYPSNVVCGTPESVRRVALSRLGRVSYVGGIIISEELGSLLSEIVARHADDLNAMAFPGIEHFSGQRVSFKIYLGPVRRPSTTSERLFAGNCTRT